MILNNRVARRATISGVERWATEVTPRLLSCRPDRYMELHPPRGLAGPAGQAWEQLVLPAHAFRLRAAVVFSPANLSPWMWPRNVLVIHDAAVLRYPQAYRRLYRAWHAHVGLAAARKALAVVTVSAFSRAELLTLCGLEPERVVVIRGGVDDRFRPDADRERVASTYGLELPYVLTVGTADPRKNLSALSETARRLHTLGMQLVWAGGVRRQVHAAVALDGVRALGYVPDEALPGLYAGAEAFVLPSLYEGFGLPCLEAMACGTPVVASDRGALAETCAGAALLVDPRDPAAVAEAVVRAATDEALRAQLRSKGLERASRASWDHTARELDQLLIELADRPTDEGTLSRRCRR